MTGGQEWASEDINKTREYDEPGDPNNPNRCRDGAVIRMLTLLEERDQETRKIINGIVSAVTDVGLRTGKLEVQKTEYWKELARLWEVVKFGNKPPQNPVPPSERWIEVNPKPAGELREWWVIERPHFYDYAYRSLHGARMSDYAGEEIIHVREVPSPERVRAALDAFVADFWELPPSWNLLRRKLPNNAVHIENLLRSLGIDTEGV